ncbi:MAG: helix-turn-helix transcriptional regulator [Eggerthellaceae bacterium]|nr:helix-turn-helix transcriptional regulator [Eggerthellaceae bacterium]
MLKMTEVRKSRGLSMSALARRAEMHVSSISQIESGRLIPYPKQVDKISKALSWDGKPKELFEEVAR